MSINNNTKGLVEAAIITALVCVFGIAVIYIPLFMFFMFLIPLPLIILAKRHGIKYPVLSLIVSYAIFITFSDVITALFLVLLPGIPAIVIGVLMNKGKSTYQIIGWGIMANLLIIGLSFFVTQKLSGIPIAETINKMFDQIISMEQSTSKLVPKNTLDQQINMIKRMKEGVILLMPSLIITTAGISVLLNYFLSVTILRRIGSSVDKFPPFRYFSLPRNIVWGFLIIYILAYGASYFDLVDRNVLMTNIVYIFQFVFAIQGMAVVVYYFKNKHTPKLIQMIVYIILLLTNIGGMGLFFIGMIDLFINLRRMIPEN